MPNSTHHQTNKSEFADDAGQWAVSKNIDLAAVMVRPVHGHVWHSPRTQNQKPKRLLSSRFFF